MWARPRNTERILRARWASKRVGVVDDASLDDLSEAVTRKAPGPHLPGPVGKGVPGGKPCWDTRKRENRELPGCENSESI